ncbi:FAD:protein FMN transferase [Streptomyces sp. SP18CS02]|uniref:FAD:protein FMN transferase n=1 Tax=Streptomyces sp. SP18CS02 TaxID=3002531 RepID=UPI002E77D9D7|nr:FAD:protein FMN transferase [Streptomyces sp. SP18CS02]MEE1751519.1 FAD:protein FMN transferase [Streptomyces sp. SP18CS02]
MGTVFSFDMRMAADGDGDRLRAGLVAAVAGLHRVDELFSTFRRDSQVSLLARGKLTLGDCAPVVSEVLWECEEEERLSDGWFTVRHSGSLDPTGLVKGWAVERAVRMLASSGAEAVCLNGGGDIQLYGGPWRVGIADPLVRGGLVAVVEADRTLGIATSGPAERGCHIIDPHTGVPPTEGLASMTVVCPGLTQADARATAAYAMGRPAREWLEGLPDTEGFAVTQDGSTWQTSGFARHTVGLRA